MTFHTDDTKTLVFLEYVISAALDNDQRLRIDIDLTGALRIKRGEGVWSAPIYSTPDPNRGAV